MRSGSGFLELLRRDWRFETGEVDVEGDVDWGCGMLGWNEGGA